MGFLSKSEDVYGSVLAKRVPKPINPAAAKAIPILDALTNLRRAEKALNKAKDKVPSYTGQWSDEDYYAEEQEAYNRAVEEAAEWLARLGHVSAMSPNCNPTGPSPFQTAMSQKIEDALPKMAAKDRKFCEGLVYIGDLVEKIDTNPRSIQVLGSITAIIRAIPARQGLEDWVRPE